MHKQIRTAERALSRTDPVLAKLIEQHGPCTLFAEDSLLQRPRFHVLAWAIINQQLSVKAALSIERKLLKLLGSDDITAAALYEQHDDQLAACGLSRQKIRYLRALAERTINRILDLDRIHRADDSHIAEVLSALPGVGPWTVDMFLMFSLGRMDVLPLGDLALRRSLALHYELPESPTLADYLAIARPWRPWCTVSSWYLWAAVD